MVLSSLQEAKTRGVLAVSVAGFQARLHTLSVWPSRVWSSFISQAPSLNSMESWVLYMCTL